MLAEAYNNPNDIEKIGSDALKEDSSKLRKVTSKGQVFINNISENEAKEEH